MSAAKKLALVQVHRATHTSTDTMLLNKTVLQSWKSPPFQRPLRVNDKVRALAEQLGRDGGVIPGVITLGKLGRDTYLLDGQHRVHAFTLSELEEGYADVRIHEFTDMGAMGEEFVLLNSRLVNLRPDDILRGLEEATPALRLIRQRCPFVGYDHVRRGTSAPILSMSAALRCWSAASSETPAATGDSALHLATDISTDDAGAMCDVLIVLEKAWGRDAEYGRLWSNLNLSLCLWMWRRTVNPGPIGKVTKTEKLTRDHFLKCMMSLSADTGYVDWLLGRRLSERDRSPAYAKMKSIVARRYQAETNIKPKLPQPAWSKGHE